MDTALVTITGNVGSDPMVSGGDGTAERVTFRVVANSRRLDRATNAWIDAGEYWTGVVCWRQLAKGVAVSIRRGDPVVIIGRLATTHYERDGERRAKTEVTAHFVGHDLSKGSSQFRRFPRENVVRPDGAGSSGAGPREPDGGNGGGQAFEPDTGPEPVEDLEATG